MYGDRSGVFLPPPACTPLPKAGSRCIHAHQTSIWYLTVPCGLKNKTWIRYQSGLRHKRGSAHNSTITPTNLRLQYRYKRCSYLPFCACILVLVSLIPQTPPGCLGPVTHLSVRECMHYIHDSGYGGLMIGRQTFFAIPTGSTNRLCMRYYFTQPCTHT